MADSPIPLRRRHAPERGGLARGALPAHRIGARRQAVRADPRRRRLDGRDLGRGRAAARRRPARACRALQAQLRPAPRDARGARARPRRHRRDDGRRPAEPARGHPAPRRGGRGRRRRRQRPARGAQRLVGPDAALAPDQRHAPPLHAASTSPTSAAPSTPTGETSSTPMLPAIGKQKFTKALDPLRRRVGRRGGRRPCGARRQLPLLAAPADTAGAARPRRLLAAADPVDRRRARRRLHAARGRARRSTASGTGSTARTSPARCSAASRSSSCSASRASSSRSSGST